MSEEINLGETNYVPSKRASDISGYAQDYIGQLARGGLIDAKRIGGLWYVDMDSLESYKKSPENIAPHEKKEPINNDQRQDSLVSFDGKDYISANRASKITGYNQDYVGQLARSGKILSRQFGNRWFIDREGILAHKQEKDSLLAAVQAESVGVYHDSSKPVADQSAIPGTEPELLNYINDNGDLLPQIEERYSSPQSEPPRVHIPRDQMGDFNEIAIQVIKNPSRSSYGRVPSKSQKKPLSSGQRGYARRQGLDARVPLATGVLIFSVVIIGSLGAVLLASGSSNQAGIQGRLAMTASAVTSISVRTFNTMANAFEELIEPELIYNRSN